jgi:hypothetical protein
VGLRLRNADVPLSSASSNQGNESYARGETMSLKKTPGQVAYEAAAAATSCTQSWEESNKAKWEAAATAVLDGQPSLEEWKVIDDFLSTHWMAFVTECKSAGIDPDVLSFKLEDAASGKLTWGDCQACNETSVVNHGKCQCCGAIHGH